MIPHSRNRWKALPYTRETMRVNNANSMPALLREQGELCHTGSFSPFYRWETAHRRYVSCPNPSSAAEVDPSACSVLSRWSRVHLGLMPSPKPLDINKSPQVTSIQSDQHCTAPLDQVLCCHSDVMASSCGSRRYTCVRAVSLQYTCLSPLLCRQCPGCLAAGKERRLQEGS